MANYKEKNCVVCGKIFKPNSPKQVSCIDKECRSEVRRRAERERYRKNQTTYKRKCLICGLEFSTTDSRRVYCGSLECENKRLCINSKRVEKRRLGSRGAEKHRYYRDVLHPDREVVEGRGNATRLNYEFVKEFVESRGYTLLSKEYVNNITKLDVCCSEGHIWKVSFHNFKDNDQECPCCIAKRTKSKPEQEIYDFVCSLVGEENVIGNDRELISPYELDIYIPSKNLAIEYCGLYWHSEVAGNKPKKYHTDKLKACNEKSVRLITIFEDEYLSKSSVVRSRVQNALGEGLRRIFARKCEVREIDTKTSKEFLARYHLQGSSGARVKWGLFYEEELVQVLTCGVMSRTHTGKLKENPEAVLLELKRFASLEGVSVVGGFGKLFKVLKIYAKENGFTHIKSYCDMRYGNNFRPVYEVLGFSLYTQTHLTPHYTRDGKRHRNQGLRKTPEERLTGKTEWELRKSEGYDRIWDVGHRTYLYEL